jgi:hypothetical protein
MLLLIINDRTYRLTSSNPDGRVVGWKLTRFDADLGTVSYEVYADGGVIFCNCADFVFVKDAVNGICKHIENLVAEGLI